MVANEARALTYYPDRHTPRVVATRVDRIQEQPLRRIREQMRSTFTFAVLVSQARVSIAACQ